MTTNTRTDSPARARVAALTARHDHARAGLPGAPFPLGWWPAAAPAPDDAGPAPGGLGVRGTAPVHPAAGLAGEYDGPARAEPSEPPGGGWARPWPAGANVGPAGGVIGRETSGPWTGAGAGEPARAGGAGLGGAESPTGRRDAAAGEQDAAGHREASAARAPGRVRPGRYGYAGGAGEVPAPARPEAAAHGCPGSLETGGHEGAPPGGLDGHPPAPSYDPPPGPAAPPREVSSGRASAPADATREGRHAAARPRPVTRLAAALADRVPVGLRAARYAVDRRGAVALTVLAVAAVAVAALAWARARPHELPPPVTAPSSGPIAGEGRPWEPPAAGASAGESPDPRQGPPARPSPGAGAPSAVVVHVAGRVVRPGVVTLPAGARVDDAVRAAGGPLPGTDLSTVNLARVPADGEQVAVGVPGAPPAPAPPGGPGTGALPGGPSPAAGPLDLNQASAEQLERLPGVGPVTARQIIEWRTGHGRFTSVDQLREIRGIGERRLADLRRLVRV